jgi:two-component sensor histidine kinase
LSTHSQGVRADDPSGYPAGSAAHEAARLAAVRRYDILDTPPDGSFDRVTALAAALFDAPIAIISIVDTDRIWFKSHHGIDVSQIDREPGLCASAILNNAPYVLTDAANDPRAWTNPLVAGEFGLRFYVAAPLRTADGFNLGTLCVLDKVARPVAEPQVEYLKNLASVVMDQMELRLSARRAIGDLSRVVVEKEAALKRTELMAKEIDHRVMNSLQLISGLLQLQSRTLGDSDAAGQLAIAATRVAAVARVHQHFYLSELVDRTEAKQYLERLCADLSRMLGPELNDTIRVEGHACSVPTAQIVPLGLIVNELVTNAAKHGGGSITVSIATADGGGTSLAVSDEGDGVPDDFEPQTGTGLGMRVVCTLVKQLAGRLSVAQGPGGRGARFAVEFG